MEPATSRRSFLLGLAGASASAALSLAGCSSSGRSARRDAARAVCTILWPQGDGRYLPSFAACIKVAITSTVNGVASEFSQTFEHSSTPQTVTMDGITPGSWVLKAESWSGYSDGAATGGVLSTYTSDACDVAAGDTKEYGTVSLESAMAVSFTVSATTATVGQTVVFTPRATDSAGNVVAVPSTVSYVFAADGTRYGTFDNNDATRTYTFVATSSGVQAITMTYTDSADSAHSVKTAAGSVTITGTATLNHITVVATYPEATPGALCADGSTVMTATVKGYSSDDDTSEMALDATKCAWTCSESALTVATASGGTYGAEASGVTVYLRGAGSPVVVKSVTLTCSYDGGSAEDAETISVYPNVTSLRLVFSGGKDYTTLNFGVQIDAHVSIAGVNGERTLAGDAFEWTGSTSAEGSVRYEVIGAGATAKGNFTAATTGTLQAKYRAGAFTATTTLYIGMGLLTVTVENDDAEPLEEATWSVDGASYYASAAGARLAAGSYAVTCRPPTGWSVIAGQTTTIALTAGSAQSMELMCTNS